MFSDGPAWNARAVFGASAVSPFSCGGYPALPKDTDESRASIQAIQFSSY